jgi:hypothetical protein
MEKVEVYFDTELMDLVFDPTELDSWKEAIDELGLEGQKSVLGGNETSTVPYPYMNTMMVNLYGTLCPSKVEVKEYSKTPIPKEVLEQLRFTIKEQHFQGIEIWYDDKSPDPVVVGKTFKWYGYKDGTYLQDKDGKQLTFNSKEELEAEAEKQGWTKYSKYTQDVNYYLIARWGREKLLNLKQLKDLAVERLIESKGAQMKIEIETLQRKLATLKENALLFINGEMSETRAFTARDW